MESSEQNEIADKLPCHNCGKLIPNIWRGKTVFCGGGNTGCFADLISGDGTPRRLKKKKRR